MLHCSALKKEENPDIRYVYHELWGHFAKYWNQPVMRGQMPVWLHLYEVPTVVKFIDTKVGMVVARD